MNVVNVSEIDSTLGTTAPERLEFRTLSNAGPIDVDAADPVDGFGRTLVDFNIRLVLIFICGNISNALLQS